MNLFPFFAQPKNGIRILADLNLRKMKGSRLLPKNLLPDASPPAVGGAMLTSCGFAKPEI
jgi:hypothetical protein